MNPLGAIRLFSTFHVRERLAKAVAVTGLVGALMPAIAEAQNFRVVMAPKSGASPAVVAGGTRLSYCRGSYGPPMMQVPIPLEWEVLIENIGTTAITVTYTDTVTDGFNGNYMSLQCPLLRLPPGVNPATDVTCNAATGAISVRNITIQPCSREFIRFNTIVDPMAADLAYFCNGGSVSDGTSAVRSRPPQLDPVPSPAPAPSNADDTCLYLARMCDLIDIYGLYVQHVVTDSNGPPLLPGDTVLVRSSFDFRYLDLVPTMTLEYFWENYDPLSGNHIALPPWIDFTRWTMTPLAPPANNAEYRYQPGPRLLDIRDPDAANPPQVDIATGTQAILGEWEGVLNCNAPPGIQQCMEGWFRHQGGTFRTDDPAVYELKPDLTCVRSAQPDLSGSTKTVSDSDMSGDAQPGETLTFTITVDNSTICPPELMPCECAGTNVEVLDTVDTTRLQNIQPLDGGVLTGPNQIRWDIPAIDAQSQRVVRFRAQVLPSATAGQQICNTATVTSAEFKSVADGGKLNCATVPPRSVALTPCMSVVIPPTESLSVSKSITSPATPPPYIVGTPIDFSITVSNGGGAAASNVEVWDCLDARWNTALLTILDGGTLNGGANPGCSGSWIRWPTIASLPGPGGTQVFRFTAPIPLTVADLAVIPNVASTRSTSTPSVAPSSVTVPVCAPVLSFTKTLPQTNYAEGDPITWTLTLNNTGSCAASGVTITDVINTTILNEPPTITGPGTYNAATDTITWNVGSVAAAGTEVYTVMSTIKTATSPGPICNTAMLSWNQGVAPISSDPPGNTHCATIGSGCAVPATQVSPLQAVRGGAGRNDVVFSWIALASAPEGYRVCSINNTKASIPGLCGAGSPVPGCDLTAPTATGCTHVGAVPPASGTNLYYQVKGVCGAVEGP